MGWICFSLVQVPEADGSAILEGEKKEDEDEAWGSNMLQPTVNPLISMGFQPTLSNQHCIHKSISHPLNLLNPPPISRQSLLNSKILRKQKMKLLRSHHSGGGVFDDFQQLKAVC